LYITGTQSASKIGTYTFRCRATDDNSIDDTAGALSSDYQDLIVQIVACSNNFPVFENEISDKIYTTASSTSVSMLYPKIISDSENPDDIYTYSFKISDGTDMPSQFSFDDDYFTCQLSSLPVGVYNIRLTAVDDNSCGDDIGNREVSHVFKFSKYYYNSPPAWASTIGT